MRQKRLRNLKTPITTLIRSDENLGIFGKRDIMLTTIKGVYEDGKITVTEKPPIKETKADVLITFLPGQKNEGSSHKRILGGLEGKISVPEDFNEPFNDLKDYM